MGRGAVLLGAAVADVGPDDDKGGSFGLCPGLLDGLLDGAQVVAVGHLLDVPAVGLETLPHVLGEGDIRLPLDGDVVVVIKVDELAQAQGPGQGCGLRGHPFHEVAVRDDGIDVVVHHPVLRGVEAVGQEPFCDGHAHPHAEALAQGAGSGLDSWGMAVFRVTWGFASPLAEAL